jgi:hypothetical protein
MGLTTSRPLEETIFANEPFEAIYLLVNAKLTLVSVQFPGMLQLSEM